MYRIETSMRYDSIVIPLPNAAKVSSDTNHSRFICCDDGSSDKKTLSHEKKLLHSIYTGEEEWGSFSALHKWVVQSPNFCERLQRNLHFVLSTYRWHPRKHRNILCYLLSFHPALSFICDAWNACLIQNGRPIQITNQY